MVLLTFAHLGEAQEFVNRKHTQKVDFHFSGLYKSDDEILLITKEGVQSTTERMASVCTYFSNKISHVINLGIAGSLSDNLQINQLYGIRKIFNENEIERTFQSEDARSKIDCITASHRVMDDGYAERLSKIAQIVDRELWACASVCSLFNLPFKSYKLISDRAGSLTSMDDIKKQIPLLSKHLFDFYKKLDNNI